LKCEFAVALSYASALGNFTFRLPPDWAIRRKQVTGKQDLIEVSEVVCSWLFGGSAHQAARSTLSGSAWSVLVSHPEQTANALWYVIQHEIGHQLLGHLGRPTLSLWGVVGVFGLATASVSAMAYWLHGSWKTVAAVLVPFVPILIARASIRMNPSRQRAMLWGASGASFTAAWLQRSEKTWTPLVLALSCCVSYVAALPIAEVTIRRGHEREADAFAFKDVRGAHGGQWFFNVVTKSDGRAKWRRIVGDIYERIFFDHPTNEQRLRLAQEHVLDHRRALRQRAFAWEAIEASLKGGAVAVGLPS
jgi:hypothetical protein